MKNKVAVGQKPDESCIRRIAPNPQTQCRLFNLPPELRNEIYTLVFAVPPNNFGRIALSNSSRHTPDKPTVLSILQSCRLIRDEAEDLFYNTHHLEIGNPNHSLGVSYIEAFIKCSNAHRLTAIRTLTVLVADLECVTKFFRLLAHKLTGLSSLNILGGGRNQYPQNAYYRKGMKREVPILKKAVKCLPVSLSYFRLRLQGVVYRDETGSIGWVFDNDISTEETQEVEVTVMASIARRKDFNGVMANLNRSGVQKYNEDQV